jgi:GT2 family glycosyltransferase
MNVNLSVLTVTYNSQRFLDGLYESLQKYLPKNSEWVIVDHGSKDNTVEKIHHFRKNSRFPIKLIEQDNKGFSSGNNRAASVAEGEVLLILNPDTRLLDDSVEKMLVFFEDRHDIGILAPKLLESTGKIQQSVRKLPTLKGLIDEYFFGKKHTFSQYAPEVEHPVEVECVYGAAMMMKKNIFEKMKGFNEKYFLYYEDIDLCRKVLSWDLKIIYFPEATISHQVGGTEVAAKSMPMGVRSLAHFFPIKSSGKVYYQIKGRNIYHGVLISFLIAVVQYIAQKLGRI